VKKLSAVLGLAAFLALSSCDKETPAPVITPVKVAAAQALSGDVNLSYSAQVVPETQVDVAFRTDGYISSIKLVAGVDSQQRLLQPGDSVQAGEMLAQVEDDQYRDQLIKAQANLDKALAAARKGEQDFRRATALNETQSITGPDFDAAEKEFATTNAEVEGAQAQVDDAQQKLDDTVLFTPLTGIVQQRNIEIGSLVHAGSVGFVVANTSVVKVIFGVPDIILGQITPGSDLAIHTESMPERTYIGEVTQIEPAADERTRIFEVSVTVDNSDGSLRPGMVASLTLDETSLEVERVVLVPITAMVEGPDRGFALYTVERTEEGTTLARLRRVETGQILGNRIVVTSGVEVGTEVIVSGNGQISDKQPVNVVP
jgi:RND family efflux transporter MFP subunit